MITYTLNTVTKFLLIMAPLIIVSGCTTIADPGNSTSQAAAKMQAEPTPDRLVRYCRRMAETKNLRIAIGICQRALAAAPENPEPVIILAEAYLEAEQRAEAAEAYRFALSIDDQSGKAHFGLGKLYLRDSRLEEARPHLEAAMLSGTQDPSIFNALGVLEDQSGNHVSAQVFYQAGLELDPDNTALANNYGVSLLLSKPSEIGNNIYGQLPPEQGLNEEPSATEPLETRQFSSASAEKRIPARNQPNKPNTPVVSALEKAVTSSASVPALVQTPDESLLGFFVDSRQINPAMMDPVITPAPVEIVDFQALPVLPASPVIRAKEDDGHTTLLARALLDYNPARTPMPEDPDLVTVSVEDAHTDGTVETPPVDLATVTPVRNPFFQSQTHAALALSTQPIPDDAASTSSDSIIQVAEIPHLPIEMPGFNDSPRLTKPNAAMLHIGTPEENHAGTPLQAELLILDVHSPLHAMTEKNVSIPGHIVTDGNFPTATTGLSLLHDNDEVWKSFEPRSAGQSQIAIHHDGTAAPNPSDFQDDAKPELKDPEAEPLLWPNSLADRNLPLNKLPSPERPKDSILAMMLLNRSALSTA